MALKASKQTVAQLSAEIIIISYCSLTNRSINSERKQLEVLTGGFCALTTSNGGCVVFTLAFVFTIVHPCMIA
jgi:hypothetical protein